MGIVVNAISGADIAAIVNNNIDGAIDLSDKGVKEFFIALAGKVGKEKISVLRIWSHGATHRRDGSAYNKGNIHFGKDQVDNDSIKDFESFLGILTPMLDNMSRVELRGCQSALGSGAKMMLRLAAIWKTEVQGSDRSQPLLTWTPPVYAARPGAPALSGANIIEYNDPSFKRH
ncbi:MAG TPA: hypothetical protein VK612_06970 [Pyrinomonadaceae bacterium]|nr:hypothetical protein [Pyrinomonadaceae bacterium]